MFNNSISRLVRQRLHVTVKAGYGYDFSGVLLRADRRRDGQYVFADVVVYPPEAAQERLDGELYIDRVDVLFVQTIPARVPHADE